MKISPAESSEMSVAAGGGTTVKTGTGTATPAGVVPPDSNCEVPRKLP